MANKRWYETFSSGDCIKDVASYNDMITYIKNSACTDFTIYSTCTSTGQAFRFTTFNDFSIIYGHEDAGKDMIIAANDSNTYPRILLYGDSNIYLQTATSIYFEEGTTQMAKMSYAAAVTTIEGEDATLSDLLLKGNSINAYSKINIAGQGGIQYYVTTAYTHDFYEAANKFLSLYEDGTDDVIEGSTAGNDLYLKPVGLLKWGTEQTNAGSDRGELIPMKTTAGVTVYLKTYDLV